MPIYSTKRARQSLSAEVPPVQHSLRENLTAEFGEKIRLLPALAWEEYGLCIETMGGTDFFRQLKEKPGFAFDMLIDITCVDWLDSKDVRFQLVYQLLSLSHNHRLCIKIPVGEQDPEVDSVRPLWSSANFLEREVWDMYGIKFRGHGDLRRILMYEEFVGHPLRKDYPLRGKQPRIPLRMPELRNDSADMRRPDLVSLPTRKKQEVSN